jgi:hypothetical protein
MKKLLASMCFASLGLALPLASHAESGTVEIVLSAVSTSTAVQMGDATVTARGGSGTVTFARSSGGPFVEGASGTVQFASFSRKTATGFELEADGVATFSSNDTLQLLFKRRSGDLAAGTSGEGVLHLTGEAGRFAGLSGECKYKVENLPGNWNVTIAKCQWTK